MQNSIIKLQQRNLQSIGILTKVQYSAASPRSRFQKKSWIYIDRKLRFFCKKTPQLTVAHRNFDQIKTALNYTACEGLTKVQHVAYLRSRSSRFEEN